MNKRALVRAFCSFYYWFWIYICVTQARGLSNVTAALQLQLQVPSDIYLYEPIYVSKKNK